MTCQQFLGALDPYLDDELPVTEVLDMHEHLAVCEACRRIIESEATVRSLLTADAVQDTPPDSLRARVLQRVGAAGLGPRDARPRAPWLGFLPVGLAGLGLMGLLVVVAVIAGGKGPEVPGPLAAELAAKHLLYSEGPRPALALTTADATQMTAWLEGRLGFSVRLPRLSRPDERLVGGRASTIADVPAGYLLYERHGRRVSLFVTQPLPSAKLGWTERVVDGVELYTAALGGLKLVWWEDEAEHRLYAAASTGGERELVELALLCVRSGQPSRLDRPALPSAMSNG
jgi:mycothiol system anti-sigma-R factor